MPESALAIDASLAGRPASSVRRMSERPTVLYEAAKGSRGSRSTGPSAATGSPASCSRSSSQCVERADLDPAVHVLLLSGNGAGFCGGYDLVESAEGMGAAAGSGRLRRAARRSTRR